MKTFLDFYEEHYQILSEELHKHLQSILDEPETSSTSLDASQKMNRFTKAARGLIKKGEDTGLTEDKPKKGSSRAVFFPKEDKPVTIDGTPTKAKTVVKIAFPGHLDRYRKYHERLLGEQQNDVESDPFTSNTHGMLRENDDGTYSTNPHGVLAPVLGRHPDHHYLEMGHVSPMKKSDFQRLTRTESHPKGIKFDEMYDALNREYHNAHGSTYYSGKKVSDEEHERIMRHPFVEHMNNMMNDTAFHPADINPKNMGIWRHPVTGAEHPVISDYGYTTQIAREYAKRRQRMWDYNR